MWLDIFIRFHYCLISRSEGGGISLNICKVHDIEPIGGMIYKTSKASFLGRVELSSTVHKVRLPWV